MSVHRRFLFQEKPAEVDVYSLSFDWLFLQCGHDRLSDGTYREALVDTIFSGSHVLSQAKVAFNLIGHRLLATQTSYSFQRDILLLGAAIMRQARSKFSEDEMMRLKEYVFGLGAVKEICVSLTLDKTVQEGVYLYRSCCRIY